MKKILALALAAGLVMGGGAFAQAPNFDDPAEFARQREFLTATPMGPEGKPWEQYLVDTMKDTAQYKKDAPYTVCFSNAGVNNPWRVVGFTNLTEEVKLHPEIAELIHVDAEGSDDKQIADIDDLLAGGKCSILIVSPNTTAALTPAVRASIGSRTPIRPVLHTATSIAPSPSSAAAWSPARRTCSGRSRASFRVRCASSIASRSTCSIAGATP